MIRSNTRGLLVRLAGLSLALGAVSAQAQTPGAGSDVTGPGGGGGGITGAVAPVGLPAAGGNAAVIPTAPSAPVNAAVSGAATSLGTAPPGGSISVPNPAGGTVSVPQATGSLISAVLATGSAGSVAALSTALTASGVASGQATALADALGQMGTSPSFANVVSAVQAYNAAIAATPAGQTPSPAILAIRAVLVAASVAASR